jgi:hypothetical protein
MPYSRRTSASCYDALLAFPWEGIELSKIAR